MNKEGLILVFASIIFACCQPNNSNKQSNRSSIKQVHLNKKIEEPKDSLSILYSSAIGKWVYEQRNLTFNIEKKDTCYHYEFKSPKRKVKGIFEIGLEDNTIFYMFKGMKWDEFSGPINVDDNDEVDIDISTMDISFTKEIWANYYNDEAKFIIQNYGNSMNYFVKIHEGADKYLCFYKQ